MPPTDSPVPSRTRHEPSMSDGLVIVVAEVLFRAAGFALFTLAATRLDPSELGRANIATLALTAAATFAGAGWSVIVQRMHGQGVPDSLCWSAALSSSAVLSVILVLSAGHVATLMGSEDAADLVRLIAPVLLLQQVAEVAQGIGARCGTQAKLALGRIVAVLLALAASSGLLLVGLGAAALTMFALVTWVLVAAWSLKVAGAPRIGLGDRGSRRTLLLFVAPLLATNALTLLVTNIDNFAVAHLLGPEALAMYVMGFGLMSLPAYLIGHSLGRILMPVYVQMCQTEEPAVVATEGAYAALRLTGGFLLAIQGVTAAVFVLVPRAFSPEWNQVQFICVLLGGFTLVRLILSVAAPALYATGSTRPPLVGGVVQLAAAVPLTFLGAALWGPLGVAATMSAVTLAPLIIVLSSTGITRRGLVQVLGGSFVRDAPWVGASLMCFLLSYRIGMPDVLLVLSGTVAAAGAGTAFRRFFTRSPRTSTTCQA